MLLAAVVALAVFIPGQTIEDTPDARTCIDDAAFCAQVKRSIVIIHVHRFLSSSKGSGIIITDRIILTAKHVVKDAFLKPVIDFQGTQYLSDKVVELDNTDAAFILLANPIDGARPIEWNMDPSESEVRAYAIGAWGDLTSITYSAGTVLRQPRHIEFDGEGVDWTIGGTVMLFWGFSGGALVDERGRLLGVSFGISMLDDETKFVDARPLREIAFNPDLFE
jgi:S1-C subfamily serine protease